MNLNNLSDKEKKQICFFIRSELFIDGIPLSWEDIEESLNGTLSARDLLSRMLNLKPEIKAWEDFFEEANQAAIEDSDLEDLLDTDINYSLATIICSGCSWRGNPEELEVDIDNISITYCPDCGKHINIEQSQTQTIKEI